MANQIVETVAQYDGQQHLELFVRPSIALASLDKQGIRRFEGVKSKLWLYYSDQLDKLTRLSNGCGWNPSGNGVDITRKAIDAKPLVVEREQCFDEFLQTAWEYALKNGKDISDFSDTDIAEVLQSIYNPVVARDMQRIMWFGDTTLIGNPAYNMIDGYFRKIQLGIAGSTIVNYTITAMATPADAYNAILAVYNNQPRPMKSKYDKKILVTRNIYDLYVTYLTTVSGVDGSFTLLMNGLPQVMFRGVEVVCQDIWDDYFIADFPGSYNFGRIVMVTVDEALVAGFDIEDNANWTEYWYERRERQMLYRTQYVMGVELHHHNLLSVGGF